MLFLSLSSYVLLVFHHSRMAHYSGFSHPPTGAQQCLPLSEGPQLLLPEAAYPQSHHTPSHRLDGEGSVHSVSAWESDSELVQYWKTWVCWLIALKMPIPCFSIYWTGVIFACLETCSVQQYRYSEIYLSNCVNSICTICNHTVRIVHVPYIPQVLSSFTHLNATWWACFGILCVPSMTLVMILVKMVIKCFVSY